MKASWIQLFLFVCYWFRCDVISRHWSEVSGGFSIWSVCTNTHTIYILLYSIVRKWLKTLFIAQINNLNCSQHSLITSSKASSLKLVWHVNWVCLCVGSVCRCEAASWCEQQQLSLHSAGRVRAGGVSVGRVRVGFAGVVFLQSEISPNTRDRGDASTRARQPRQTQPPAGHQTRPQLSHLHLCPALQTAANQITHIRRNTLPTCRGRAGLHPAHPWFNPRTANQVCKDLQQPMGEKPHLHICGWKRATVHPDT